MAVNSLADVLKAIGLTHPEEQLSDLVNNFAYQGYDPLSTFNTLYQRAGIRNLKKDLWALATWYVYEGSNPTKVGIDTINAIRKHYKLADRPNKATDITIARAAGCAPHVVAVLLQCPESRIVGSVPPFLPRFLCSPTGPYIIPKGWNVTFNLWRLWNLSFIMTISFSSSTSVDASTDYGLVVYESSYVSDTLRKNIMKELGVQADVVIDPKVDAEDVKRLVEYVRAFTSRKVSSAEELIKSLGSQTPMIWYPISRK